MAGMLIKYLLKKNKTPILAVDAEGEVEDEDLIEQEDMVVTVTHSGYVKRTALSTYRAQKRGGKGLIQRISSESRVPVIKHLNGVWSW